MRRSQNGGNRRELNANSYCLVHFHVAADYLPCNRSSGAAIGYQCDRRLLAQHVDDQRSELRQQSERDVGCFGVSHAEQRQRTDRREFSGRQSAVELHAGNILPDLAIQESAAVDLYRRYRREWNAWNARTHGPSRRRRSARSGRARRATRIAGTGGSSRSNGASRSGRGARNSGTAR
jgi:hypothetical protein